MFINTSQPGRQPKYASGRCTAVHAVHAPAPPLRAVVAHAVMLAAWWGGDQGPPAIFWGCSATYGPYFHITTPHMRHLCTKTPPLPALLPSLLPVQLTAWWRARATSTCLWTSRMWRRARPLSLMMVRLQGVGGRGEEGTGELEAGTDGMGADLRPLRVGPPITSLPTTGACICRC